MGELVPAVVERHPTFSGIPHGQPLQQYISFLETGMAPTQWLPTSASDLGEVQSVRGQKRPLQEEDDMIIADSGNRFQQGAQPRHADKSIALAQLQDVPAGDEEKSLEEFLEEALERAGIELDSDEGDEQDNTFAEVLDQPTEAAMDDAFASQSLAEEEATYLRLNARKRGPFLFTPKQPVGAGGHAGRYGGVQASCPYHAKSKNSKCRKYIQLPSTDPAAKLEVMRKLCYWCLHAKDCDRQRYHLSMPIMPASSTPTLKEMWAELEKMSDPGVARTDVDLDAEEAELAKPKAKAKAKTASKAKAKSKASSSSGVISEPKRQSKRGLAKAKASAVADAQQSSSSSSSNSSSNSSDSSSTSD
eukprot:6491404-Amphidinium_carterae.4